jgi:hypothetical protein
MCYEVQQQQDMLSDNNGASLPRRLKARCKEAINVLGMVTLNDTDRLLSEGQSGRGWIACVYSSKFLDFPGSPMHGSLQVPRTQFFSRGLRIMTS